MREKKQKKLCRTSTEHYSLVLKSGDMEKAFDDLVWHLEEPSWSKLSKLYASKLAINLIRILTGMVAMNYLQVIHGDITKIKN